MRELIAARPARAELEAKAPIELVGHDTFYIGRLKGVGRVWQYTVIDVASSYNLLLAHRRQRR